MPKTELITRIPKNGNQPYVAMDYYTEYPGDPFDLTGYTGTGIFWIPFELQSDAASGQADLVVDALDDSGVLDGLVKGSEACVIGGRTNQRYTVSSVSGTTITLTGNLTEDYYEKEIVKIIWKEASIGSGQIVVGEDGVTKNRVQIQLADTETIRVYGEHRVLYKLKNAGGTLELAIPDSRYIYYLDIYDDSNALSL